MQNLDAISGAMPPETMRSMLQQSRQYQAIMPKSDTPSLLEQSEKLERLIADAPKNNPAKRIGFRTHSDDEDGSE